MANGNVVPTKQDKKGNVIEYTVYPTGDANSNANGETLDRNNVKFAIDNVTDSGTVVLKRHKKEADPKTLTEFNFGGDYVDTTIYLTKNVTITGRGDQDPEPTREWPALNAGVAEAGGATIKGGRWPFRVGVYKDSNNIKQVSVTIKDIRFTGFYRGAIFLSATKDKNLISGCSFVNYDHSAHLVGDEFDGAWPIIADRAASPDDLMGELTITQNFFGSVPPSGPMNNLLHVSFCNLKFTFSNNRITDMYWAGLVVYANKGETIISGNNITKMSSFVLGGAGIAVGVWPEIHPTDPPQGRPITIEGNTVEIGSTNTDGIHVFLMDGQYYKPHAPNPDQIWVRNNTVHMIGDNPVERAALTCFGACSKSEWVNNTVDGKAPYGIWVAGQKGFIDIQDEPPILSPSQNTFQDNNLEEFTATKAQVLIGETVEHLKLLHNKFGHVSNNNAQAPPLDDAVAEIRCKGHLGQISENEFQKSGIMGWHAAPAWLGCIYLDKQSNNIQVQYRDSDFPNVAVIADEIYNGGQKNHVVRLGP